ncbi:MAG: hypothetical protein GY722_20200 [bacterium]|nr:hypothetical protein [bacterium]
MSIKDFQSKIQNENGTIFKALRKLSNIDDTAKVLGVKAQMAGWNTWPTLEAANPACS